MKTLGKGGAQFVVQSNAYCESKSWIVRGYFILLVFVSNKSVIKDGSPQTITAWAAPILLEIF